MQFAVRRTVTTTAEQLGCSSGGPLAIAACSVGRITCAVRWDSKLAIAEGGHTHTPVQCHRSATGWMPHGAVHLDRVGEGAYSDAGGPLWLQSLCHSPKRRLPPSIRYAPISLNLLCIYIHTVRSANADTETDAAGLGASNSLGWLTFELCELAWFAGRRRQRLGGAPGEGSNATSMVGLIR